MLPAILGVSGPILTPQERDFIRDANPFGFILFRRNIDNPQQTKHLIESIKEACGGNRYIPFLVDQEGGKVQRLRPPHWVDLPQARAVGDLFVKQPEKGLQAVTYQAEAIAGMLHELGFTAVCAPVMDVPVPGAHDVIGDRAFSERPQIVATLATHMLTEFLRCGMTPIAKHAPGHGRAMADSHYACPIVKEDLKDLIMTDFVPYHHAVQKTDAKDFWTMTAHVVYTAIDELPVSVSSKAIDFMRHEMGLNGLIIPDAIEMEALGGTLYERALATLKAGCDVTLYCAGVLEENIKLAAILPAMTDMAVARARAAEQARDGKPQRPWKEAAQLLRDLIPQEEAYIYAQHHALNVA